MPPAVRAEPVCTRSARRAGHPPAPRPGTRTPAATKRARPMIRTGARPSQPPRTSPLPLPAGHVYHPVTPCPSIRPRLTVPAPPDPLFALRPSARPVPSPPCPLRACRLLSCPRTRASPCIITAHRLCVPVTPCPDTTAPPPGTCPAGRRDGCCRVSVAAGTPGARLPTNEQLQQQLVQCLAAPRSLGIA